MDGKGKKSTLVELETYLKTGSHIGTRFKTGDMERYIFKNRKDGLRVLDVSTIDERLRIAASFLSRFEPSRIAVVSRRLYGQEAVKQFSALVGATPLLGRFVPGTFTNPDNKSFFEPHVLLTTDPDSDRQAIKESVKARIPVISLGSTNSSLRNVDLVVPINNKGRKSLALAYFLLAREILKEKGTIKGDAEFGKTPDDFEYKLQEGSEEEPQPKKRVKRRVER